MSFVDKQIVASLDRLHADQTGKRSRPCRFKYNGILDEYECECNLQLSGRMVIDNIHNTFSVDNSNNNDYTSQ